MKNIDFLINKEIAHRGIFDNKKVPENSIKAFLKAINKKYTIELDVFKDEYDGLIVAEVEFKNIDEAKKFIKPNWFLNEITYDKKYTNASLSKGLIKF